MFYGISFHVETCNESNIVQMYIYEDMSLWRYFINYYGSPFGGVGVGSSIYPNIHTGPSTPWVNEEF